MTKTTITLTFGDAGENHVGMEQLGECGQIGSGFTCEELRAIYDCFKDSVVINPEYYVLNDLLDQKDTSPAALLVLRGFVADHADLFREMNELEWDTKYFDVRRNRVLNKRARANLMLLEGVSRAPDYENRKGTIVDISKLPGLSELKATIEYMGRLLIVNKFRGLVCEGNKYRSIRTCGIGYHGDTERRKVIGVRLGATMPLHFQWFHKGEPVGDNFLVRLHGGDLYIMSEKAVGHDWRDDDVCALRHAAGCDKYVVLKK